MKRKMVYKLSAMFMTVLLLFTIVLGSVFFLLFRRHTIEIYRDDMKNRAQSIADTLSSLSDETRSEGHGRGNGMGGYGAYLHVMDGLTMDNVWIVDRKLQSITHGHNETTKTEDLPEDAEHIVEEVFQGEITYSDSFSGMLDNPSLTIGVPIYDSDNKIMGAVLLHSPVSGVDDAVKYGVFVLFLGVGAATVFALVAAILFSWNFTKPLFRMKNTALKLAAGDYTAKTELKQEDEIGELANTIDLLAGRLEELEHHRETLDQAKEEFFSNVSHELRTPVAVLRGSLENLRDGTVSEPGEVLEYYEQMLGESRYIERLVNDLLDLSRLQDAGFKLDMKVVMLNEIARDSVRTIRQRADKKSISLEYLCDGKEFEVDGDYVRIRQMFLILLDNAVKFSKEGGRVNVCLEEVEGNSVFGVTNYGKMISKEELPYIFERFHKNSDSENRVGSGLGLAIAKQIALRHDARIQVLSNEEKTQFSICFLKSSLPIEITASKIKR